MCVIDPHKLVITQPFFNMVLSMLKSFGKIGPQIDQIWAWQSRGHRWSAGVRNPLKSSVTGPSLLVNCYLEVSQNNQGEPPPPGLSLWKNDFEPMRGLGAITGAKTKIGTKGNRA